MFPSDDDVLSALRSARPDPEYRPSAHSPEAQAMLARVLGRPEQARDRRRVTRRRLVLAGIPALVAAAVAVVAGVVLPAGHLAGHPASHPASEPGARLAAWTVTRQADGTIHVTFRQVTDPARLQRTLRADGVPASVTFTGHQNPACRSIPRPRPPRNSSSSGLPQPGPLARVIGRKGAPRPQGQVALVIHPAALPPGEGVQIWTSGTPGAADNFRLQVNLVHASPRCTGS